MKACQIKLIFFTHTLGLLFWARQSEVYITGKALASSCNFSEVVAPQGRRCHKSIWRDALRSFAHMSHAWSVNGKGKGHFLVVAVWWQQEKERERVGVGEIDSESRKATLLPHFRLKWGWETGLPSNRPHITCKLRQLFSTSFLAWPAQRDLRPSEMSGHF